VLNSVCCCLCCRGISPWSSLGSILQVNATDSCTTAFFLVSFSLTLFLPSSFLYAPVMGPESDCPDLSC
jgi:hypothetical protein